MVRFFIWMINWKQRIHYLWSSSDWQATILSGLFLTWMRKQCLKLGSALFVSKSFFSIFNGGCVGSTTAISLNVYFETPVTPIFWTRNVWIFIFKKSSIFVIRSYPEPDTVLTSFGREMDWFVRVMR